MARRDYSLLGPDAARAVETGLAAAEWYHTDVPRKEMKALMERTDQPAIRDTVIYYGAMILFAALGIWLWPTWWSVPFWLAYGVLYGSASDSRWHECGHGTAFRTAWMNNAVYQIASFMIMRNAVTWRWSHARHHTDTIIVGRDPEIAVMRPPVLVKTIGSFLGIPEVIDFVPRMIRNAISGPTAEERTFVPESEWPGVARIARIHLGIYAVTLVSALAWGSLIPLMLVGLPRMYGAWHHIMTGLLQHGGLADNVTDHRLNSRTVLMNPVSRFIYWNMNYHVEHHMFPMVPYHRLPALHVRIGHDLPAPTPSILAGFREMWPAFIRQLKYEDYHLRRDLPATARPYREDLHAAAPGAVPAE